MFSRANIIGDLSAFHSGVVATTMLARTFSAAVIGIDAYPVEVEVNATGRGEQSFVSIVGLPDTAVKESRDRVRSALQSCGFPHPEGATLVNLAPADLRKEGAAFDLPIALGMLAAVGLLDRERLNGTLAVGELALNGAVRPVRGVLPVAVAAGSCRDLHFLLVPRANVEEAALAAGDLGIAMGAIGSDIAINSASIALMNNDLRRIPMLVSLSKQLRMVINQNLLVGLLFVFGGIVLSVFGWMTPIWAALLHTFSTLLIIFNSARLVRTGEELTLEEYVPED